MARKPKAVRPEAEGKTQAERFLKTAREVGADETGEAFERAMDKIVPPKRPAPQNGRVNHAAPRSKQPK